MLLQPPNPQEKRANKLVIKPKESRLFVAEMVRLKKPIERTILVKRSALPAVWLCLSSDSALLTG